MKLFLSRLTRNRVLAAITGAVVTAVLNSSSVTTVLVVGFISAGLLSLTQAIGVIMGANIGSTFTAQIVAFDVNRYALALIGVGFVMFVAARRKLVRHWGGMIMGLGLVLFELVLGMWDEISDALSRRDLDKLDEVATLDDGVDSLHGSIVAYLGGIHQAELTAAESRDFVALLGGCNYVENMGDVIESNLVGLGRTMIERDLYPSETMRLALGELGGQVREAIANAVRSIAEDDRGRAEAVLDMKAEIDQQVDRVLRHQAGKLAPDDLKRLEIFRFEMGVVDDVKRLYTLAKRMAKLTLADRTAQEATDAPAT